MKAWEWLMETTTRLAAGLMHEFQLFSGFLRAPAISDSQAAVPIVVWRQSARPVGRSVMAGMVEVDGPRGKGGLALSSGVRG